MNKVKFIEGVISDNLRINKVKRKVLICNMIAFGLKPMSAIASIMSNFKVVAELDDASNEVGTNEELAEADDVSSKEFEYLLSMPLWSLTEERVNSLIKLM